MAELKKETHLDSENRNLATNLSQQTHQMCQMQNITVSESFCFVLRPSVVSQKYQALVFRNGFYAIKFGITVVIICAQKHNWYKCVTHTIRVYKIVGNALCWLLI